MEKLAIVKELKRNRNITELRVSEIENGTEYKIVFTEEDKAETKLECMELAIPFVARLECLAPGVTHGWDCNKIGKNYFELKLKKYTL